MKNDETHRNRKASDKSLEKLKRLGSSVAIHCFARQGNDILSQRPHYQRITTNCIQEEDIVESRVFTCGKIFQGNTVRLYYSLLRTGLDQDFGDVEAALAECR